MNQRLYTHLQLREIFHLEFLHWLAKKVKVKCYALKGGVNLRLFFQSRRYSEDMDLDVQGISVQTLKEAVMKILGSATFQKGFITFGIEKVIPPDIRKAKQTETTQRFKVHLILPSGEDLFTKVEFSRRGFKGTIKVESVDSNILRTYRLPPLIVPHYDAISSIMQKIDALATRSIIQPRDIFDLYTLIPQANPDDIKNITISRSKLKTASEGILSVGFERFRDTVISYLSLEDQQLYNSSSVWDEVRLKVVDFIEKLQ